MRIRDREIVRGGGYVVAEAGTNHWHEYMAGSLERAQRIVGAAALAGADAIKFQIFVKNEPLFCPKDGDELRWERWHDTILSVNYWRKVAKIAHSHGLAFIGSAFQPGGVDIVQEVCDAHKVAARANETYPWDKIVDKPVIVSSLAESGWGKHIPNDLMPLGLYCVPKYPCPPKSVAFEYMAHVNGYSDHCPGPWMSIKALALGAAIVEKHFVIFDRDKDPDGSHAATPEELKLICQARDAWK